MTEPLPDLTRLHHAVRLVCKFLNAHQIAYAIGGGLAVAVGSQPRATSDVDIVVAVAANQDEALRTAVAEEAAFLLEAARLSLPPHTTVIRAHLRTPAHPEPDLLLVDFILVLPDLTASIIQRRVQLDLEGQQLWFVGKEDLVVLKLLAGRAKDLEDRRAILTAHAKSIDRSYIQAWAQHLGGEKSWAAITSA